MPKFYKSNPFKILLGISFISAGVILYTTSFNENIFSSTINSIVMPVQKLFTRLSNSAEDVLPSRRSSEDYEREIEDLKSQLRDLRSLTVDYYDVKKENSQYAKYYEFKRDNPSLKFVSASVVGRDPSELFYSFTIDHGSTSGISVNDTVITENGLVGWISEVSPVSSKVKTILSPEAKVGATDKMTNESGVITGNIKLADSNLTRMTLIPSPNTIKQGDIVTTSGISGRYPKNIQIGKINSLEQDEYDALSYGVLEPFEDIKNIREVFVVTYFLGKGEITLN